MNKHKNPFVNLKLSHEESQIDQAIESGEVKSVKNQKKENARLELIAKHTASKTKNINIRVSLQDLNRLKVRAMENGLPYQTLISTILKQFTSGKIQVQI